MSNKELFAKQAFAAALASAFGLTVLSSNVSAETLSENQILCLALANGQTLEGTFEGDEDGGEIHLETNARDGTPFRLSYSFEADKSGRAIIIDDVLTQPIEEEELAEEAV